MRRATRRFRSEHRQDLPGRPRQAARGPGRRAARGGRRRPPPSTPGCSCASRASAATSASSSARSAAGDLGALPVIVGLIIICVVFQSLNSNFLTAGNLSDISVAMVGTGMIAVGIVFVLLLGEIDLSVGSVSGLAGAAFAVLSVTHGMSEWLALVLAHPHGCGRGRRPRLHLREDRRPRLRRHPGRSAVLERLHAEDPRRATARSTPATRASSTTCPTTSSATSRSPTALAAVAVAVYFLSALLRQPPPRGRGRPVPPARRDRAAHGAAGGGGLRRRVHVQPEQGPAAAPW